MRYFLWQSNAGFFFVCISLFLSILIYFYVARRTTLVISRNAASILLAGAIGWLCLEYFLGAYAPVYWDDEGDIGPPIFNYVANIAASGQTIAHEFAGGVDRYAMMASGSQYFSIEILLIRNLPVWAVFLVNKTLTIGMGVIGMYLMCRRVAHSDRFVSFCIACCFFAVDHFYIDSTFIYGFAWGAMPFISVVTADWLSRRSFLLPACVLALVFATLPPTHAGIAGGACWLISALFFYRGPTWRPIAAFGAMVVAMTANWHEMLWAFWQVGPTTMRGTGALPSLARTLGSSFFPGPLFLIGCAALIFLCVRGDRFWRAGAGALALSLALPAIVKIAFLSLPGLEAFATLSWGLAPRAGDVVALLIIARAIDRFPLHRNGPSGGFRRYLNPAAAALGYFVFMSSLTKGDHFFELVHTGGHSQYSSIGNLKSRDWQQPGLYRVVTLQLRQPDPNIPPGMYGFDAFDGTLNLVPKAVTDYWFHGVKRKPEKATRLFPILEMNFDSWSFETLEYDLNAEISPRALRAANVQYVLSPLPLRQGPWRLVSGPDFPRALHGAIGSREGKLRYYRWRWEKIRDFGDIYVYRLEDSVPRAFGAAAISVRKGGGQKEVIRDSVDAALSGAALVPPEFRDAFPSFEGRINVGSVEKTVRGYTVTIDAPRNGAVVLNAPFSRFWEASVDGVPARVVPANFIQMAIAVPGGSRKVEFIYNRPLLKDVVAERIERVGRKQALPAHRR